MGGDRVFLLVDDYVGFLVKIWSKTGLPFSRFVRKCDLDVKWAHIWGYERSKETEKFAPNHSGVGTIPIGTKKT